MGRDTARDREPEREREPQRATERRTDTDRQTRFSACQRHRDRLRQTDSEPDADTHCASVIVTEPLEYTKNKQQVAELPLDLHLRKLPAELHAETTDAMKTTEFKDR